jgi:SAM-dependent methyltransferase
VSSVLSRVDAVLVQDSEMAIVATRLGASRVSSLEQPPLDRRADHAGPGAGPATTELSTNWASYVGAIEAMAAGDIATHPEVDEAERRLTDRGAPPPAPRIIHSLWGRARRIPNLTMAPFGTHSQLRLTRASLPEWVVGSDVLDDGWQAEEARDEARRLGLPRTRNPIAAWAALGALAAVIRVADDGHRGALVGDESGPGSPLTPWLTASGFAPVDLGLTFEGSSGRTAPDLDPGCLDVVARLHPGGCDASDVDEVVAAAAWALRPGGLLVFTVPLGGPDADLAMGPADVRALVARAHEHGFVLVGDLDGSLGHRMRAAAVAAGHEPTCAESAAYGLVRLTLRRR